MVDLEAIRARLRAVTPVTPPAGQGVTPKPAPCLAVTPVTPVTPETSKSEGETLDGGQEGGQASGPGGQKGSRVSLFSGVTDVTGVTTYSRNGFSVTPAVPGGVTGVTGPAESVAAPTARAPRFRAWTMLRPGGCRAGTVLDPAGMDHAEALAAVDRWPGVTVEPVAASRC